MILIKNKEDLKNILRKLENEGSIFLITKHVKPTEFIDKLTEVLEKEGTMALETFEDWDGIQKMQVNRIIWKKVCNAEDYLNTDTHD